MPATAQGVGDQIECKINDGEWATGTVVKTRCCDEEWPASTWAAYQVKLDTGLYIYAPIDQDEICRAAPPAVDESPPSGTSFNPMPLNWDSIAQWDRYVSTTT